MTIVFVKCVKIFLPPRGKLFHGHWTGHHWQLRIRFVSLLPRFFLAAVIDGHGGRDVGASVLLFPTSLKACAMFCDAL
jgi:hypothetical protein